MNLGNKLMLRMLNEVQEYNNRYPREKVARIIDAMKVIDRKLFVPAGMENAAYDDAPLPIGHGQTISQPSTVARMILLLGIGKGMNILEIGAGSGWNAALLSYIVHPGRVTAIERIGFLTNNAKKNIEKIKKYLSNADKNKLSKIILLTEDALNKKSSIWESKYDRIIITAGIERDDTKTNSIIRNMASRLLRNNGILICPYTVGPLQIYRKEKRLKKEETSEEYVFVPLLEEVV
jgi:protein-L-isoaspartate(D-aspartate) O-methyltransferase